MFIIFLINVLMGFVIYVVAYSLGYKAGKKFAYDLIDKWIDEDLQKAKMDNFLENKDPGALEENELPGQPSK